MARTAVKSFIVNDAGELLLIKRREHDPHTPGAWDVPGGRLEDGEDVMAGLKRETKEETGLEIEILHQLCIHEFTREDGQEIKMTTYLCRSLSHSVVLSKEHIDYAWLDFSKAAERIHKAFLEELDVLRAGP